MDQCITVVQYEPAGKGKRQVVFDNGERVLLYASEAAQLKLAEGLAIPESIYRGFLKEVVGKRAKKRALHILERMDRTEKQLRDKLEQGGYPAECIEDAIAYVKHYRYLDDYRYACSYIECVQERMSRRQLAQKLQQKGVSRELAENAIQECYAGNERTQIFRLLEKKGFEPECSDRNEMRRIYQYLLRRGFSGSDIRGAMLSFQE